jgi:polyphosphate glucokinase
VKVTTLTVDCGGTGIKASVLDKTGKVLIDFPYLKTPYPLSPSSNSTLHQYQWTKERG